MKWTTKAGAPIGGRSFDKCRLHALLTNPIYVGRIKHKAKEYAGDRNSFGGKNGIYVGIDMMKH